MKNMPTNSLIEKFLPANYVDSYSRIITSENAITPDEFRNLAFNQLPKWIDWLMRSRSIYLLISFIIRQVFNNNTVAMF